MSNFSLRLKQRDFNLAAQYMVLFMVVFIGYSELYSVFLGGETMWSQLSSVTFSIVLGFLFLPKALRLAKFKEHLE